MDHSCGGRPMSSHHFYDNNHTVALSACYARKATAVGVAHHEAGVLRGAAIKHRAGD